MSSINEYQSFTSRAGLSAKLHFVAEACSLRLFLARKMRVKKHNNANYIGLSPVLHPADTVCALLCKWLIVCRISSASRMASHLEAVDEEDSSCQPRGCMALFQLPNIGLVWCIKANTCTHITFNSQTHEVLTRSFIVPAILDVLVVWRVVCDVPSVSPCSRS